MFVPAYSSSKPYNAITPGALQDTIKKLESATDMGNVFTEKR